METKLPRPAVHRRDRETESAHGRWLNTRDPNVALAYSIDTKWRNRAEFLNGRDEVKAFLRRSGPRNSTTA
jgi:nuclear transport factor 2 (NTF2) superfamily protein